MNNIEKLLQELCPNGVQCKALLEIAEVTSAGVDKKIIQTEKKISE